MKNNLVEVRKPRIRPKFVAAYHGSYEIVVSKNRPWTSLLVRPTATTPRVRFRLIRQEALGRRLDLHMESKSRGIHCDEKQKNISLGSFFASALTISILGTPIVKPEPLS